MSHFSITIIGTYYLKKRKVKSFAFRICDKFWGPYAMHKDSLLCVERRKNGWFVRNGSKYRDTRKNIHLSTKTSTIQIPVNGYKEIRDQINTVNNDNAYFYS